MVLGFLATLRNDTFSRNKSRGTEKVNYPTLANGRLGWGTLKFTFAANVGQPPVACRPSCPKSTAPLNEKSVEWATCRDPLGGYLSDMGRGLTLPQSGPL